MQQVKENTINVPVSVVIPCYRCSATVGHAVSSVIQQSVSPVELILVDDASGDDTFQALQKIALEHPGWVKVLQLHENKGAAGARNAGWALANQDYVAFLDADDAWHPEKLRIQHEYMRANPDVTLCGHQCEWLQNNGKSYPEIPTPPIVIRVRPTSLIFKSCFSTPTVMLKRDLPFRFPENKRYSEDLNLWQQIAFAGFPVVRLESPLAYVYKAPYGEGGLSADMWEMEKGELCNIRELYREGKINWLLFSIAPLFSMVKYVRRLLLGKIRRLVR